MSLKDKAQAVLQRNRSRNQGASGTQNGTQLSPTFDNSIVAQAEERWYPELAAEGYTWCMDCQHWGGGGADIPHAGPGCTHPDNRFHCQQPLAPNKCQWFQQKEQQK